MPVLILLVIAVVALIAGYVLSLLLWKRKLASTAAQQLANETKTSGQELNLACGCSSPCDDECEELTLYQISEPDNH